MNLIISLLAAGALSPCPSNVACIAWAAPTQNTDNSPITHPLRYRLYRNVGAAAVVVSDTTSLNADIAGLPLGQQCFYATAIDTVSGYESDPSNTTCKTLRLPAPTDGSIEAPTDGSIEFP